MNKNRKNNSLEKAMGKLDTPVTITECVQISRGVAEDVVSDYHRRQNNLQISMSIQMEIIKSVMIENGLITEEEFKDRYLKEAEKIDRMQREAVAKSKAENPAMKLKADDVEVETETREE